MYNITLYCINLLLFVNNIEFSCQPKSYRERFHMRLDQKVCSRLSENWNGIEADELMGYVLPKCKEILTEAKLRELLARRERLRVKFGIDPTASDIHLGHVVPVMLLRQFARAGHHVDFIIGDFTARVGDPTERQTGRIPLSVEKIEENMRTYQEQIGIYIDLSLITFHHNASWLNPMPLQEVFAIFQQLNLAEAMQRDDFRSRLKASQGVSLAEVCYGVLMGIDSVHLRTQLEIGGIDQLLNFQQCRKIMRLNGMEEETIAMTPMIEGTSGDGRKMSKSYGNAIAVRATAEEQFGKIMSIPDSLIVQYFCSFADIHQKEVPELEALVASNPMEAKKQLATVVVALRTKSFDDGLLERQRFERKFSRRSIVQADCIQVTATPGLTMFQALEQSGEFKSRNELRRMFEQHAVRIISGEEETTVELAGGIPIGGCIVRVGKRKFFQIHIDTPE